MKRVVSMSVLVVFLIGFCVSFCFSSEKNLIKNGSMEEKEVGAEWKIETVPKGGKGELALDKERPWGDGKQSLKVTNGEERVIIHQTFGTEAGKKYRVTFWAKVEPDNWIWYVSVSSSKWQGIKGLIKKVRSSEWQEYEFTFEAPDEKTNISISNSDIPYKSMWLDDISVVEVKEEAIY